MAAVPTPVVVPTPPKTGVGTLDTWLQRIVALLNPVLALGTVRIQGRPVPAPLPANDGQAPLYNAKLNQFVYGSVGGTTAPLATNAVFGITKLSVLAASAADPIAVGDNDPRNIDARTPTGPASGGLGGNYPNPTVLGAPPTGAASGSLAGSYPGPTIAASGVGAATYGDSTHVAQVAVAADGRVTAASNVAIVFPSLPALLSPILSTFFDDFYGYQIDLRWNQFTSGTGTVAPLRITDGPSDGYQDNGQGMVDLALLAGGDAAGIDFGGGCAYENITANKMQGSISWRFLYGSALPPAKMRCGFASSCANFSDVASGIEIALGWDLPLDSGNVHVHVFVNSANGVGEQAFSPSSPIPVDGLSHTFTITWAGAFATPRFLFDGVDTGIDVSASWDRTGNFYLQPFAFASMIYPFTVANTHLFLDYVYLSKTRNNF